MANKLSLLEALHELEINDQENLNYLTPKYKQILEQESELKQDNAAKPSYLERLHGKRISIYFINNI